MASDTDLIEILIQTGIGPVVVAALIITGWLFTRRHMDDANARGNDWRSLYEFERDARQHDREENRRIMQEVSATLATFGTTLGALIVDRDENRRFREMMTDWTRRNNIRGPS